jgi:hypothetical protein
VYHRGIFKVGHRGALNIGHRGSVEGRSHRDF